MANLHRLLGVGRVGVGLFHVEMDGARDPRLERLGQPVFICDCTFESSFRLKEFGCSIYTLFVEFFKFSKFFKFHYDSDVIPFNLRCHDRVYGFSSIFYTSRTVQTREFWMHYTPYSHNVSEFLELNLFHYDSDAIPFNLSYNDGIYCFPLIFYTSRTVQISGVWMHYTAYSQICLKFSEFFLSQYDVDVIPFNLRYNNRIYGFPLIFIRVGLHTPNMHFCSICNFAE